MTYSKRDKRSSTYQYPEHAPPPYSGRMTAPYSGKGTSCPSWVIVLIIIGIIIVVGIAAATVIFVLRDNDAGNHFILFCFVFSKIS